ncbi:hypothetical protein ACA910_020732 [Epithemia clementina (nom. ined.)]
MAQTDLAALELRLYRLELKLLGDQLHYKNESDEERKHSLRKATSSPMKFSLSKDDDDDDDDMAVLDTEPQTKPTENDDFATRLSALEQQMIASSKSSSHRDALEGHWKDIHQYLQDLDPGSALTHQQSIASPFMYRRQEVLASADDLKRNMQYVSDILNLLLIGQNLPSSTSGSGGSSSSKSVPSPTDLITEMHVTKAPILMTAPALSREKQEELIALEEKLQSLRDRVDSSASKLDRLLTAYQKVVSTVSEKLVLMDEEIRLQQQ